MGSILPLAIAAIEPIVFDSSTAIQAFMILHLCAVKNMNICRYGGREERGEGGRREGKEGGREGGDEGGKMERGKGRVITSQVPLEKRAKRRFAIGSTKTKNCTFFTC